MITHDPNKSKPLKTPITTPGLFGREKDRGIRARGKAKGEGNESVTLRRKITLKPIKSQNLT